MRAAPVLLAVLAMPLLAGCLGEPSSPIEVVPFLPLNDAEPGRGTEFAFQLRSTSPFRQQLPVTIEGMPEGWTFEPEAPDVDIGGRAGSSLVVRITPGPNATYGPHAMSVKVGDTRSEVIVNVRDLGDERLRAGIGARLHYVLWYANGTLASTNEPVARDRPQLGRAVLDDANESTYEPLKVYVGGARGTPPPEPYNGTGYRPVIPGFDARLRDAGDGSGMVAGETLAVRVPKEKAYTVAGNEEHVLYGEDLAFLIRVVGVDVLETRDCGLPVCPV